MSTNLWWGFVVPRAPHPLNCWQWDWKAGVISQTSFRGWNMIGASAMLMRMNRSMNRPGLLSVEKHVTATHGDHEVQHTVNASTAPGNGWTHSHENTYLFRQAKWNAYLKNVWNNLNLAGCPMPQQSDVGVQYHVSFLFG